MAYDERLAERISELIHARPGVSERKMFGGMGWTIGGNMAVGVMRHDHLVVRLPPEEVAEAIEHPHVREFGREGSKPMKGFVVVDREAVEDDAVLADWVDRGAARAQELPPK
jgi:TfoX/Sxy family transcriptional regulator of competence genes